MFKGSFLIGNEMHKIEYWREKGAEGQYAIALARAVRFMIKYQEGKYKTWKHRRTLKYIDTILEPLRIGHHKKQIVYGGTMLYHMMIYRSWVVQKLDAQENGTEVTILFPK